MPGKWLAGCAVAFGVASIVVGCGGRAEKPAMGRVRGTVMYEGKPLDKGRITFTPIAGDGISGGTSAMSPIASDGSFDLTTFDTNDGAIVGQHNVTVTVPTQEINDLNKPKADGSISYVLPKELVPKKYTDPATTPLKNTVVAGDNNFTIELMKK